MESLEIPDLFTRLAESLDTRDHPWRWPVLSTVSPDAQPHARIVVLREFHDETAIIFTDVRTRKITDLRHNPSCSLLFFDPDANVQVRAEAIATLHLRDAVCETRWADLNDRQRSEYQAIATPAGRHSPEADNRDPSLAMTNFAVLALPFSRLDILQLTRQAHIRQIYTKRAGQWTGGRVIA